MARVSADEFGQYVIVSMAGCASFKEAPVLRSALQFAAAAAFAGFAAGRCGQQDRVSGGSFSGHADVIARGLFDKLQSLPGVAGAWNNNLKSQFRQAVAAAFAAHCGEDGQ